MVGRTIENEYPPRPDCAGETILEIKDIHTDKLKDVQLHASQGRDPGPRGPRGLGPHGAGSGPLRRGQGREQEVLLDGKPVQIRSPSDAMDFGLAWCRRTASSRACCSASPWSRTSPWRASAGLTERGFISSKEEGAVSERQIKALNVKTPSARPRSGQPLGRQPAEGHRRAGGWRSSPRILIMDEPTKGHRRRAPSTRSIC